MRSAQRYERITQHADPRGRSPRARRDDGRHAQHHEREAQAPRSGESNTHRVDQWSSDPSTTPSRSTLREVGGAEPTPRRVRSATPQPATTHSACNPGDRGSHAGADATGAGHSRAALRAAHRARDESAAGCDVRRTSTLERQGSTVAPTKRSRTAGHLPPCAARMRTECSDQTARRRRRARSAPTPQRRRQGAQPRQGANRPHRTASTKD